MCITAHTCRSEDNLQDRSFLQLCEPRSQAQVVRLGGKRRSQLNHLTSPQAVFFTPASAADMRKSMCFRHCRRTCGHMMNFSVTQRMCCCSYSMGQPWNRPCVACPTPANCEGPPTTFSVWPLPAHGRYMVELEASSLYLSALFSVCTTQVGVSSCGICMCGYPTVGAKDLLGVLCFYKPSTLVLFVCSKADTAPKDPPTPNGPLT